VCKTVRSPVRSWDYVSRDNGLRSLEAPRLLNAARIGP
jgi:hypothetical protein